MGAGHRSRFMPPQKKLLLVGWDSADLKIVQPLVDSGAMPSMAWEHSARE
jgi:hypothetical protein